MRYTESRLAKITQEAYLADLDKDIVDFVPNFDETEKEPEVLPVRIPNLLVNGAEGIAVGMATSIPTHNLGEVIDAVKAYMRNNEITTEELLTYLKGPDFPTGGIVVNKDDLPSIYETGTGTVSYTHLDVYKRQGYQRTHTGTKGGSICSCGRAWKPRGDTGCTRTLCGRSSACHTAHRKRIWKICDGKRSSISCRCV